MFKCVNKGLDKRYFNLDNIVTVSFERKDDGVNWVNWYAKLTFINNTELLIRLSNYEKNKFECVNCPNDRKCSECSYYNDEGVNFRLNKYLYSKSEELYVDNIMNIHSLLTENEVDEIEIFDNTNIIINAALNEFIE